MFAQRRHSRRSDRAPRPLLAIVPRLMIVPAASPRSRPWRSPGPASTATARYRRSMKPAAESPDGVPLPPPSRPRRAVVGGRSRSTDLNDSRPSGPCEGGVELGITSYGARRRTPTLAPRPDLRLHVLADPSRIMRCRRSTRALDRRLYGSPPRRAPRPRRSSRSRPTACSPATVQGPGHGVWSAGDAAPGRRPRGRSARLGGVAFQVLCETGRGAYRAGRVHTSSRPGLPVPHEARTGSCTAPIPGPRRHGRRAAAGSSDVGGRADDGWWRGRRRRRHGPAPRAGGARRSVRLRRGEAGVERALAGDLSRLRDRSSRRREGLALPTCSASDRSRSSRASVSEALATDRLAPTVSRYVAAVEHEATFRLPSCRLEARDATTRRREATRAPRRDVGLEPGDPSRGRGTHQESKYRRTRRRSAAARSARRVASPTVTARRTTTGEEAARRATTAAAPPCARGGGPDRRAPRANATRKS